MSRWHGAANDAAMTHIAIQTYVDGSRSTGWNTSPTAGTSAERPIPAHAGPVDLDSPDALISNVF